ncbi:TPA: YnaM/YnfT family protein [Klebsiella michiganensis]
MTILLIATVLLTTLGFMMLGLVMLWEGISNNYDKFS